MGGRHAQAEEEAGDEGWEADGVRKNGAREGEARVDGREVLRGQGAEDCRLSCSVGPASTAASLREFASDGLRRSLWCVGNPTPGARPVARALTSGTPQRS